MEELEGYWWAVKGRKMDTHDNTATKVFGEIEQGLWYESTEPFRSPCQDGEEGAKGRTGEDDEDGCDSEAKESVCASSCSAIGSIAVVSEVKVISSRHDLRCMS